VLEKKSLIATAIMVAVILSVVVGSSRLIKKAVDKDCFQLTLCDKAEILSPPEIKKITHLQEEILRNNDVDFRVLLVPDVGSLEQAGNNFFVVMRVGSYSLSKQGVFLLVDTKQNTAWMTTTTNKIAFVFPPTFNQYVGDQILSSVS
jgi:uncharacterized membrane protein YgcG